MEKVCEFSRWAKRCHIKHAVHSFMQDVIGDAMLGAQCWEHMLDCHSERHTDDDAIDRKPINCDSAYNFPDEAKSFLMHDAISHSQQESAQCRVEYRYQPNHEVFHLFNKIDLGDLDEADSCSDPEDQAFSD
jgi:hypothetical protein